MKTDDNYIHERERQLEKLKGDRYVHEKEDNNDGTV